LDYDGKFFNFVSYYQDVFKNNLKQKHSSAFVHKGKGCFS